LPEIVSFLLPDSLTLIWEENKMHKRSRVELVFRFVLPAMILVAALVRGGGAVITADAKPGQPAAGNALFAPDAAAASSIAASPTVTETVQHMVTNADRQAAAERAAAARAGVNLQAVPMPEQGGVPDYFGLWPNWANSQLPEVQAGRVISGTGIRKFVDALPGLTEAGKNNLGQYITVGVPDTTTYPGSDYFEIGLVQYKEKMHSDLNPTTLRAYVQLETAANLAVSKHITLTNIVEGVAVPVLDKNGQQVYAVDDPHYLGPIIVAERNVPSRIKFTNFLPTGAGGNLFIPVDTSTMGAGTGPDGTDEAYTQNRATLHLHGGVTPWISDGTPHQWTVPMSETTAYPTGVSVAYVPDMPQPDPGSLTFFYSNQQSARLMFYHDHAYGLTRLNVYAGEAAGYLLQDEVEKQLIADGVLPADEIPLVIQDKTFVPTRGQLDWQDPTWVSDPVTRTWGGSDWVTNANNYTITWGQQGDLWFPHVYMPNQNPYDLEGAAAMGRWDYGPWFWPPLTPAAGLVHGEVSNPFYGLDPVEPAYIPGIPNPSMVPEGFMDTPVVNGTPYPYLTVEPKAYRFRILNAANDRFWNLQLYQAASNSAMWKDDGTLNDANAGEVPMVAAVPGNGPACGAAPWPTDGRAGGVPNPNMVGPAMVQIGTEGGFLPAPVTLVNTPIGYNYNRRDIVVLNVADKTLFLGPAERADVIVDFSQYAGRTLILYNDAPAPVPAFDTRTDYYTGDPDQRSTGGAPSTLPGYGPNTRTIMQIRVNPVPGQTSLAPLPPPPMDLGACPNSTYLPMILGSGGTPPVGPVLPAPFDFAPLFASFVTTDATHLGVFAKDQDPIIVPQAAYNSAYGLTDMPADAFVRIQYTTTTFTPITMSVLAPGTYTYTVPLTIDMAPKAIQELFELNYGRMNATLGVEMPRTNFNTQTTLPLGYIEPPTEVITDSMVPLGPAAGDGTQIWKITHNGVDTHAIHFHLFNVQLINRVGWDGAVRPPDPNELGWKETVKMNPLEDAIVALRAVAPELPWGVPVSQRNLDVTQPTSGTVTTFDLTNGRQIQVPNDVINFGWEYVWHCHLLGHEENDMMRPVVFNVATAVPAAPSGLNVNVVANTVDLSWTDPTPVTSNLTSYFAGAGNWGNPTNEIYFEVTRTGGTSDPVTFKVLANHTSFTDANVPSGGHTYSVVAVGASGPSAPASIVVP
jgi:FtsP/CotA-like multicopper oxidase with cupredoxin domain